MRKRTEFAAKVKVAAFERAKGKCEECGAHLFPGNIHYDHRIPDALGGEATVENCQCLCRACHGSKTAKKDVPQISKAKRVAAKHIGAKKSRSRPIPGSKASGLKRKVDGTVVRRD